eukprot:4365294-Pyramimonas_sp.AAC.1
MPWFGRRREHAVAVVAGATFAIVFARDAGRPRRSAQYEANRNQRMGFLRRRANSGTQLARHDGEELDAVCRRITGALRQFQQVRQGQ